MCLKLKTILQAPGCSFSKPPPKKKKTSSSWCFWKFRRLRVSFEVNLGKTCFFDWGSGCCPLPRIPPFRKLVSVWNPHTPTLVVILVGHAVASLLVGGESQPPQFLIKTSIFVPQKNPRPLDVFWGEEAIVGRTIGPKIPILDRAQHEKNKKLHDSDF